LKADWLELLTPFVASLFCLLNNSPHLDFRTSPRTTEILWGLHTEKTGCSFQATINSKSANVSINFDTRVVFKQLTKKDQRGDDLRHALLLLMESNLLKKGISITYNELRDSFEKYLRMNGDPTDRI
jgi:hypothetical protein